MLTAEASGIREQPGRLSIFSHYSLAGHGERRGARTVADSVQICKSNVAKAISSLSIRVA